MLSFHLPVGAILHIPRPSGEPGHVVHHLGDGRFSCDNNEWVLEGTIPEGSAADTAWKPEIALTPCAEPVGPLIRHVAVGEIKE